MHRWTDRRGRNVANDNTMYNGENVREWIVDLFGLLGYMEGWGYGGTWIMRGGGVDDGGCQSHSSNGADIFFAAASAAR